MITPDVKLPSRGEEGLLILLDVGGGVAVGEFRDELGGSAFAQVVEGDPELAGTVILEQTPDLSDLALLRRSFVAVQVCKRKIRKFDLDVFPLTRLICILYTDAYGARPY